MSTTARVGMVMSPQPWFGSSWPTSATCGISTLHSSPSCASQPTDLHVIIRGCGSGLSMFCHDEEQPYESTHSISTSRIVDHFFFLFGLCVRADAATLLAALLDLGLLRILLAVVATRLDVCSLRGLAMSTSPKRRCGCSLRRSEGGFRSVPLSRM